MLKLLYCCPLLLVAAVASADEIAIDKQVKPEARVAFTEGPAWHPSGNVFFTDISNNRIMRRDKTGALHIYRTPSGRANGLAFDATGRLIACEGGGEGGNRRVTRTAADGVVEVLADRFEGRKLNSPNDCIVDSRGRIFFSDPRYGDRTGIEQKDRSGKAIEGVYRIDTNGDIKRIITHEVHRPNGLAISSDNRYLFVGDNENSGPGDNATDHRRLWRFTLDSRGGVVPNSGKVLFNWGADRGPDGMTIDSKGRLFVTAGFNTPNLPRETSKVYKAGVYVIGAEGGLIDFIPVPADMVTNCSFGDADLKTLYITAGHKLWSVSLETPGVSVLTRKKK